LYWLDSLPVGCGIIEVGKPRQGKPLKERGKREVGWGRLDSILVFIAPNKIFDFLPTLHKPLLP
jgi:hypothetical protein